MKKTAKIAQILAGIGSLFTLTAGKALAAPIQENLDAVHVDGLPTDLISVAKNISSIALGIIAVVSVIMLIYGGIKYITSAGDSKKVTDAKNTILYAIIGLVICLLSYAIINFVVNAILTA